MTQGRTLQPSLFPGWCNSIVTRNTNPGACRQDRLKRDRFAPVVPYQPHSSTGGPGKIDPADGQPHVTSTPV